MARRGRVEERRNEIRVQRMDTDMWNRERMSNNLCELAHKATNSSETHPKLF